MLHRSFKPAKCKTALKLAVSRIKLLKHKKASHVAQLRREVAQLLHSGQERTARIRVEHVIREEKMMVAYDLLEVYCEQIVARLAMIESQKNCPIDLKEAITSVIFASPRCADLPELLDARKHFQSKYGKEFTTAALELRRGCGVSRMMIEKLSAGAPDAQTKINILSAIALEHNVKWDPNTSGENEEKPPEDLLNGPNNFLRGQKYEEPHVQTPTVDTQKNDAVFNRNPTASPASQNETAMYSTSQSELDAPNARAGEMEHRYTYSGDQNTYDAGKRNWNIEFTDATCAAQAAAEAAERASMAARAAVELSSGERMTRQKSSGSQRPSVNDLRNGSVGRHKVSTTTSDANVDEDPADKLEHGGDPRMRTDNFSMKKTSNSHVRTDAANHNNGLGTFSGQSQVLPDPALRNDRQGTYSKSDSSLGRNHSGAYSERISHVHSSVQGTNANEQGGQTRINEQLNKNVHQRGSSRSDSLKSSASFHEDEVFPKSSSQEGIFSDSDKVVKNENIFVSEARPEMRSSNYTSTEAEDINYFADEQLNLSDSPTHSPKYDDNHDSVLPDMFSSSVHDVEHEHERFHPHNTEIVVFDRSGSDDDADYKYGLTGGFKDDHPDPFRSPDHRSPIYESPKRSSMFTSDTSRVSYDEFNPKSIFLDNESSSIAFSGDKSKIVDSSISHESFPVAFNQSDSEFELDGSDSEVELNGSDIVQSSSHKTSSRHTSFGKEFFREESVAPLTRSDDDEPLQHIDSSSHSSASEKECKPKRESSFTRRDEQSTEQPCIDAGKKLNLGTLGGGLRNKGKKHHIKFPSDDVPFHPSNEIPLNDSLLSAEIGTSAVIESSCGQGLSGPKERRKIFTPRFKATYFDSVDDSDSEDLPQIDIRRNQERCSQNTSSLVTDRSSFSSRPTNADCSTIFV